MHKKERELTTASVWLLLLAGGFVVGYIIAWIHPLMALILVILLGLFPFWIVLKGDR